MSAPDRRAGRHHHDRNERITALDGRKDVPTRSGPMALTKRDIEAINEELQIENRHIREEVTRLTTMLANATAQYRQLHEQSEQLARRYARLKALLSEYAGEIEAMANRSTGREMMTTNGDGDRHA